MSLCPPFTEKVHFLTPICDFSFISIHDLTSTSKGSTVLFACFGNQLLVATLERIYVEWDEVNLNRYFPHLIIHAPRSCHE